MTVDDQLAQARADLESLDTDTPTLQANLTTQEAELDRLRREARAGRAAFPDVVMQQTRRDAAAGILEQHLSDVAAARGLVAELEAAQVDTGGMEAVRAAWQVIAQTTGEYAAATAKLEKQLQAGLDRLSDLKKAHQAAQQQVANTLMEAGARGAGLTRNRVGALMREAGLIVPGSDRERLMRAMQAFAEQTDPDAAPDLLAVTRDVGQAVGYGPDAYHLNLRPEGAPLVMHALKGDRRPA